MNADETVKYLAALARRAEVEISRGDDVQVVLLGVATEAWSRGANDAHVAALQALGKK